ncbi:hypothetical protein MLD38_010956 [Melastoma candidum]|uniref:Uncharacterized protein n=1 Tax=Melastoma candidum TaxID=119954 RepID=A0ACB9R159_9MYRT|nr:hypothetical protein MLD38_010956 [Melastoma candidum]
MSLLSLSPFIALPTSTVSLFAPLLSFPTPSRRRSPRRLRLRRRLPIPSPSDFWSGKLHISEPDDHQETLRLTLDFPYLDSKARALVSSARDAYLDLQTLVTTDENGRLVVSCKRGTLRFVGGVLVVSVVSLIVVRVLVKLVAGVGMWFRRMNEGSREVLVVRRDRSLGGREVVVAKREARPRVLENPVSSGGDSGRSAVSESHRRLRLERQGSEDLPEWWPKKLDEDHGDLGELEVDKEFFRREANRLVREIVDNRLHGKDIVDADIVQLRRLCRRSGIEVSFGTENTRDSFYRTSVDFVMNSCNRGSGQSVSVQIDGEDPRQFIAGLAESIGLEKMRAARIVSAAVAARTRSCFLQSWALEMQGEHSEAMSELSKICVIHQIFPPREFSPEMEMVALGLKKQLKLEQREFLMNMVVGVCGEEGPKSLAEALSMVHYPNGSADEYQRTRPTFIVVSPLQRPSRFPIACRRTPPKLQPSPQQVTAAVRIAPWTGVAVFSSDLFFR